MSPDLPSVPLANVSVQETPKREHHKSCNQTRKLPARFATFPLRRSSVTILVCEASQLLLAIVSRRCYITGHS